MKTPRRSSPSWTPDTIIKKIKSAVTGSDTEVRFAAALYCA